MRRADRSSRGVLPTVMRRCVWSRNLANEDGLVHWGLSRQKGGGGGIGGGAAPRGVVPAVGGGWGWSKNPPEGGGLGPWGVGGQKGGGGEYGAVRKCFVLVKPTADLPVPESQMFINK